MMQSHPPPLTADFWTKSLISNRKSIFTRLVVSINVDK